MTERQSATEHQTIAYPGTDKYLETDFSQARVSDLQQPKQQYPIEYQAIPHLETDFLSARLSDLQRSNHPTPELVDILNELAWRSHFTSTDRLSLAEKAYEHAVALDYFQGQAVSLRVRAHTYAIRVRPDLALPLIVTALDLLPSIDQAPLAAHICFVAGETYRLLGEYPESMHYHLEALKLYEQIEDRLNEAETLNVMGIVQEYVGKRDRAIELMQQSLQILRTIGARKNEAMVLNNLAFNTMQLGDYDQAERLAEQSLEICRGLQQAGEHVKAYGFVLDTLGDILARTGQLDRAEHSVLLAREENRLPDGTLRYNDLEASVLQDLGRIYLLRADYSRAQAIFEETLAFCSAIGFKNTQALALRELVSLHEKQGNAQEALHSYKELHQLKKVIFNEESHRRLQNLQVLYDTAAAKRESKLLKAKNQELAQSVMALEQAQASLHAALEEVSRRTKEQARLLEQNELQRRTIRDLSVPVLPMANDILVMPLIGALDTERLHQLQAHALSALQQTAARYMLLDITGVPLVDSQVAQGIIRTVQAAKLLGTEVILIGIRPEVAQAIVSLGIELHVRTTANLQAALRMLGVMSTSWGDNNHI